MCTIFVILGQSLQRAMQAVDIVPEPTASTIQESMARDRRAQKRVIVYRATVPDSNETREVEYSAISEALHFACRDLREGRRQPIEILEDGQVVHDAAEIARLCHEMTRELAEESGLPIDDDF